MRTDCRHYESRTYSSGEVVHKCRIDVAPEAPWRCPNECPMFEKRMFDAGWNYGSLAPSRPAPEPSQAIPEVDDAAIAALLDEAEDVVNTAAPEILAEHRAGKRKRMGRRKKR